MSDFYYYPLPHPHGLLPASLLSPWHFPSKNTGVGSHSLLHGNPYPGIEHGSPVLQADFYYLSHQGSCWRLEVFFKVHSSFGKSIVVMVVELKSLFPFWMSASTCRSLTVGLRISAAKNFLACVKSFSNSEVLWFPLLRPSGENSAFEGLIWLAYLAISPS